MVPVQIYKLVPVVSCNLVLTERSVNQHKAEHLKICCFEGYSYNLMLLLVRVSYLKKKKLWKLHFKPCYAALHNTKQYVQGTRAAVLFLKHNSFVHIPLLFIKDHLSLSKLEVLLMHYCVLFTVFILQFQHIYSSLLT